MSPIAVAAGDFDEDGLTDLVVSGDNAALLLLFGHRSGRLGRPTRVPVDLGDVISIAVADFDGDGHRDLALGGDYAVNLVRGFGDGTFAAPERL